MLNIKLTKLPDRTPLTLTAKVIRSALTQLNSLKALTGGTSAAVTTTAAGRKRSVFLGPAGRVSCRSLNFLNDRFNPKQTFIAPAGGGWSLDQLLRKTHLSSKPQIILSNPVTLRGARTN